ncbi:MAG: hypothetical protein ACRCV5_24040 [Afipia sp.]
MAQATVRRRGIAAVCGLGQSQLAQAHMMVLRNYQSISKFGVAVASNAANTVF